MSSYVNCSSVGVSELPTWPVMADSLQGDSLTRTEVRTFLLKEDGPKTLEEVAEGASLTVQETECALKELIGLGAAVCKQVPTDSHPIQLYWADSEETGLAAVTPIASRQQLLAVTPIRIGPPSKKSRMPFKSPARPLAPDAAALTPSVNTPLSSRKRPREVARDQEQLLSDVKHLQEKLSLVESRLVTLADSYSEDELQLHIEKLHEYNEVKDMAQLLLGKLAEVEGTTTTSLYEQFGLELSD